jgi:uncharacterized SAM-binding protein YcdF (DUF218 family)
MFWFKKLVSPFFMPLSLVLLAGTLGLILAWSRRWRPAGRALLALSFLALLLASNEGVSRLLIDPLEARYPAIGAFAPGQPLPPALAACRQIVVLGGGNGDREGLAALDQLSTSARARLTEALRLSRRLPAARVIFSGPVDAAGEPSHARIMRRAAVSLGLDEGRTALIEDARDTEQEAVRIKALVGGEDFALVTSAWHLPRAMALCRKLGLHAFPCPTDYLDSRRRGPGREDFTWTSEALQRTTAAVHERLGLWWERLRGQI